jgi:heterodisulfide reductase subunit A
VLKTKRLNKRKKAEEWVFDPEGPSPRSVAIIHCVGSRDANFNAYCSRVCCMYSLKFAHLVKEKLPDATCYEFYIDMRAFGKGYDEFFQRIKAEGTFVMRGRSGTITEHDGQMIVRGEDIISDKMMEFPVDMVLLAVGLVPAARSDQLAWMLGIPRDEAGWFAEADYNADPTGTERGGVYVAGMSQGPKDIPDTVAQASAVAARVLKTIVTGKGVDSLESLSLEDIETRAKSLATV